jgi:hypothetical protein
MKMALQIGGTTVVDNSRNLINTSVDAARINSGTLATARLGSGTASSSNFLRGDQTWQSVPTPTITSTAEAKAGTNNTNVMTPLRTREAFNAGGSAPVYACRAWVNFDGNSGGAGVRSSGNVSSVTGFGTGNYTVNFTTAMPDANYSAPVSGATSTSQTTMGISGCASTNYTTTSVRILCSSSSGSGLDNFALISLAVIK